MTYFDGMVVWGRMNPQLDHDAMMMRQTGRLREKIGYNLGLQRITQNQNHVSRIFVQRKKTQKPAITHQTMTLLICILVKPKLSSSVDNYFYNHHVTSCNMLTTMDPPNIFHLVNTHWKPHRFFWIGNILPILIPKKHQKTVSRPGAFQAQICFSRLLVSRIHWGRKSLEVGNIHIYFF